jgi:hypothetical protein
VSPKIVFDVVYRDHFIDNYGNNPNLPAEPLSGFQVLRTFDSLHDANEFILVRGHQTRELLEGFKIEPKLHWTI